MFYFFKVSFQLIQDCGALGQNAHLVETSVGEGFYTEDSSNNGLPCPGIRFQKVE